MTHPKSTLAQQLRADQDYKRSLPPDQYYDYRMREIAHQRAVMAENHRRREAWEAACKAKRWWQRNPKRPEWVPI